MSDVKLFESQKIRSHWDAEKEKWYFSVVDVIEVLTDSNNPRRYWSDLKRKLEQEGFDQLYEILVQLKLVSADGKKYVTDCTDTKGLLRVIQSIPSPKAEPFKQWLAKVGYERIEETQDPERSIDRAMENYLKLGYSKEWVNQRRPYAFISFNFFCKENIPSRKRAASMKSRSRAAFSISFFVRAIAFSTCGMV
jgi:BRO family, N-terminal domain